MEPVINWVAVVVAAVASFVIGMVWYSPMLFGNTWMKLSGVDPKKTKGDKKKMMLASMLGGAVTALVTSSVMAHFIDYTGATTAVAGAVTAFWAWLGFVATVQAGSILWEGKPTKLFLLNTAQSLASLVVIAVINAVMV